MERRSISSSPYYNGNQHLHPQAAPGAVTGNGSLPPPTSYGEYKRNKHLDQPFISSAGVRVKPTGESGRRGFHPIHFLKISFRSASRASLLCNLFWPLVPAALAVRYSLPERHTLIFILSYIAMVPPANLIGFAGQELTRKLPHVAGVLTEITCGSIVEIILFMVLLSLDQIYVIKAAILGSILATMVLCLGFVFFVGGMHRQEQTFSHAVSEAGSGLLLTAGVVLAVPTAFAHGLPEGGLEAEDISRSTLDISRIISIILIVAYLVFIFFQTRTHHGIYDAIFEADEARDRDHTKDAKKAKLTLTECIIALVVGIALVTIISITLVLQIEHIIEYSSISDPFMGLILVPLVEKFAEHLTAIDEAFDNQMNFALSAVLGSTLQTALFNAPLTVIVGWGLGKAMDLNFDIFNLIMLILAILTVGRFLQDQKSNYLEGVLLIFLYMAIAVAAFYFPNPVDH
ncbi:hypothetical protein B0I35DRAFT_415990 [Stachybotrys elegans]|uniref:Vacuolar calcium ion transporter n=1 Tax=Stachybotrys elegans TaxID=80388 RepID=A0A8K0T6C0_9HYPO|nr:hypothetical protein B0I35DRAFT_415990 [Stachybotrys elegans]